MDDDHADLPQLLALFQSLPESDQAAALREFLGQRKPPASTPDELEKHEVVDRKAVSCASSSRFRGIIRHARRSKVNEQNYLILLFQGMSILLITELIALNRYLHYLFQSVIAYNAGHGLGQSH